MPPAKHMGTRHTRPARIGVVGMGHFVYWPQFPGLRETLMAKQASFASYFSPAVEVVDLGYADDFDSAAVCVKRALTSDLDALFIVMSTYVTSQVAFPFARYLRVPQVLVALQPLEGLDLSRATTRMQLENDDICSLPEFTGVYERLGAPAPFLLVDYEGNRERTARRVAVLERAIRAAAAFKYAKFGYLGHTYDGMYDMNTDPTAFAAAFGAHVKMLEMCELAARADAVTEAEVQARVGEIRETFDIREPSADPLTDYVTDDDLAEAARCSVALDGMVEDNGLTALAYFYRGEPGNRYERLAANLIIGNSRLTSRGIPLAGEADLKTAAAMLILSQMGGGGTFAELHPFDVRDDIVLIGHDGPHNLNVSEGKPVLRKLKKFHGKPGAGVSVEFRLRTGPVTLLSCSVGRDGRFRLIDAAGESMPGAIPATGNTNTRCRFSVPAPEFVERWASCAPTHHLALGVGDLTEEISVFARMTGIELHRAL